MSGLTGDRYFIITRKRHNDSDRQPIGTILTLFDTGQPVVEHHHCGEIMECLGQTLDKAEYPELYAVIGDVWQAYNVNPIPDFDGTICMDNDAVDLWDTLDDSFRIPDLQAKVSK